MSNTKPLKYEAKTSLVSFIVFFLSILYIISPIDFIPDFIPIVGWIDDLIVLFIGVLPMLRQFLGGGFGFIDRFLEN